MQYVSTRDSSRKKSSYSKVLLDGISADGGLYVPAVIPAFTDEEIVNLSNLTTYEDLFVAVRGRFIGEDMTLSTQIACAKKAFASEKFPYRKAAVVTPLKQIDSSRFIQDLSGGPTAAFKDMALQAIGQDMQAVLSRTNRRLDILGATSGDTGSAAGEAVIGNAALQLFMLSPTKGPTKFQQAQMALQTKYNNVHHIQFPGTFDDCQEIVKHLSTRHEFSSLGAMNSINWSRIASQVPYYFSGYFQAVGSAVGEEVDFVVPTGNFGNVLAGYVAKQMGLPIRTLVIATNENSVLVPLVNEGRYERPDVVHQTSSPSMDISVASNYERLFYWLSGNDAKTTTNYMQRFRETGEVNLGDFSVANDALRIAGFWAGSSSHKARLKWIHELATSGSDASRLLIDPHTADAVEVSEQYIQSVRKNDYGNTTKVIILSTAKPVKFESTVKEALGYIPDRDDRRFVGIEDRARQSGGLVVCQTLDAVADYIRRNRF